MADPNHRRMVLIGNPENRRVSLFCAAARKLGVAPQVVAYEELLAEGGLDKLRTFITPEPPLMRIESPGENSAVESALIRLGGTTIGADAEEIARAASAAHEHGRIAAPRLWYAGYCELLLRLEREFPDARWMNHPAEIALMFDKAACGAVLRERGLAMPEALATSRELSSYDEVRAALDAAGWRRAFLKLRSGSSASGVIAWERSAGRVRATTSVELVREAEEIKLFNSLRVRTYQEEGAIADIVNALCREGLHVERWLPKAGLQRRAFDLRVLLIGGRVRHLVMRTSRGPITNLHLGNQRGDLAALFAHWPREAQQAAWGSCTRAAAAFPRSLYCGIDLLLLPNFARHAILELNAFGDLLPGVLSEGEDTYTAELRGG